MKLLREQDVVELICKDRWMMDILKTVQTLRLPDCWICAGFIRSKVWDVLHHFQERTPLADVDVVYCDKNMPDISEEKRFEEQLLALRPDVPWSVKNEARMHRRNNIEPYTSTLDAVAKFPETATAIAVRLDNKGKLILCAPHGVHDLLNMEIKPTPYFKISSERMKIYYERLETKKWKQYWYKLS
ncbi:nucleotidyltransferase family protein [Virgibacillus kimchii]